MTTRDLVLIETSWNVKVNVVDNTGSGTCINRNIVECKDVLAQASANANTY